VDRQTVNKAKVTQMSQAAEKARATQKAKQASESKTAAKPDKNPARPTELAKFGVFILFSLQKTAGVPEVAA
jgi:hypothetical protein